MRNSILNTLTIVAILLFGWLCPMDILAQGQISRPINNKPSKWSTNGCQKHGHQQSQNSGSVIPQQIHQVSEPDGYLNGHGYVDLGLPSGVKWATCNLGANQPNLIGNYYAWGDVKPSKEDYVFGRSVPHFDIGGNSTYDAASNNWGNNWRMPSVTDIEEIRKECKWIYANFDDNEGFMIIGKNGKSIFLPFSGSLYWIKKGEKPWHGEYWTSTTNFYEREDDIFSDWHPSSFFFNNKKGPVFIISSMDEKVTLPIRPIIK